MTGNLDETGLDMCAFAMEGLFLMLWRFDSLVAVPWDTSPHFTIVVGFLGPKRMILPVTMKGPDFMAPSPYHCQLLGEDSEVYLAQTESGWITDELKHAYQMRRGLAILRLTTVSSAPLSHL